MSSVRSWSNATRRWCQEALLLRRGLDGIPTASGKQVEVAVLEALEPLHRAKAMSGSNDLLSPAEVDSLRESIRDAVLGAPTGMTKALQDDPQAYLRLVAATRAAAEETSRLLREAIDGARHAGHSWDTLGQVLGVSRQAAQQRFASPVNTPGYFQTPGDEPARKVLTPLTAFDEMAVLEQQGRLGWHVVDYGTLHHVVEASPWQWEHRRVLGSVGARRHNLEDEGWQLIKTMWFPWAYYKRCLNVPAEPDSATS